MIERIDRAVQQRLCSNRSGHLATPGEVVCGSGEVVVPVGNARGRTFPERPLPRRKRSERALEYSAG
jgi:hypothetical protein